MQSMLRLNYIEVDMQIDEAGVDSEVELLPKFEDDLLVCD